MRKFILAVSAIAAAAMPVAANAAATVSAAKSVRAGTSTTEDSKVSGAGLLIVALAAVAVGGGLYMAIDGGDDNSDSN
ncbi:hypothetical protein EQZ23_11595 [Sphingomonas sp. UV9]|jgi:hypothetical protein|uniref:Uncharacterized protein n=2 Tax=Sphingomonas TaxID=13687 RepID=A0A2W4Z4B9_9SPHN|nr:MULTISPECIES: hypothetical protein [Sphingomonas]MBC3941480.1 hypothetical protein [Sphingomonas albertensis]PZO77004.1 MAG: hypothetical protein DI640_01005 [Sphingomonas taxi]RXD05679.1 hypothetical protein EQZ23_11595 [Sphingomonas sp. UV9]